MPLVDYSSDSSSSNQDFPSTKRQKLTSETPIPLPALPSSFRDLYATPVRTSKIDDPDLHGGRQRANPHVDGNWPTHVYAEWIPSREERQDIDRLVKSYSTNSKSVHTFLLSDLGAPVPLHISLSSSISLPSEKRNDFDTTLKLNIEQASVKTFKAVPIDLKWVPNESETRWFLVLQLDSPPKDELNRLLKACNSTATSFGFPTLYASLPSKSESVSTGSNNEADWRAGVDTQTNVVANEDIQDGIDVANQFHISVAWSLSKPLATETLGYFDDDKPDTRQILSKLIIVVDSVKVKIGNTISTLSLKPAVLQSTRRHMEA